MVHIQPISYLKPVSELVTSYNIVLITLGVIVIPGKIAIKILWTYRNRKSMKFIGFYVSETISLSFEMKLKLCSSFLNYHFLNSCISRLHDSPTTKNIDRYCHSADDRGRRAGPSLTHFDPPSSITISISEGLMLLTYFIDDWRQDIKVLCRLYGPASSYVSHYTRG